jgi:hypothetical protein
MILIIIYFALNISFVIFVISWAKSIEYKGGKLHGYKLFIWYAVSILAFLPIFIYSIITKSLKINR